MEELIKLQNEIATLSEFINLRRKTMKKYDSYTDDYLRMVLPPYERELLSVARIRELMKHIYDGM